MRAAAFGVRELAPARVCLRCANTEKCDVRTEPRARVGSHTHAFTLNPKQWVTKQHGVNKAEALYNELNLRHFEEV